MSHHVCRFSRLVVSAMVVALLMGSAGLAQVIPGFGGTDNGPGDDWTSEDAEYVRYMHQQRLKKDLATYTDAFAAVKLDEEKTLTAMEKAISEAETNAAGNAVAAKRKRMIVQHKTIGTLMKIDYKYGRVYEAATKVKNDKVIEKKTLEKVEQLLADLKTQVRANRERIADLYEQVEQPRKALAVLEGLYNGLSETERASATTLKERINTLKKQLGIKVEEG